MSEMIRVLQLGSKDWSMLYPLDAGVKWSYAERVISAPKTPYDLVFIDRGLYDDEIPFLQKATKAHTLFVTAGVFMSAGMKEYYACKKGKHIQPSEIPDFLLHEVRNYFTKPYGEKFNFNNLSIAQGFSGSIEWNGHYGVTVEGEYGESLSQIAYWRNNIPVFQGQAIDFWLEYEKDATVEIALEITQFRGGSISEVQQKWHFSEADLEDIVVADNQLPTGPIFVSLLAKGQGKLKITALHDRYSRRGHGTFLPGGERYVTNKREEIFYYFDPGDRKPPLNIYFSGYKTMEGFEGYYMMRAMGTPFLLIAEPRLTGGCFYMGDEEYEDAYSKIITQCMDELGFSSKDVIMSGLSMGSFGALYYSCDIRPDAVIVGKPLINIGNVAQNERIHRPGGFPTSLDVLNYIGEGMDEEAINRINQKFWDKFENADFSETKLIVSYMIEDDYDMTAYKDLLSHLKTSGVQIYGKGIHGRHNDATGEIVNWFKYQYQKILFEDFDRG